MSKKTNYDMDDDRRERRVKTAPTTAKVEKHRKSLFNIAKNFSNNNFREEDEDEYLEYYLNIKSKR
jgi:hypothetical protein